MSKANAHKHRVRYRLLKYKRYLLVRLSEEQNHRCCGCGVKTFYPPLVMSGERIQNDWATLERVLPGAFGGKYVYANLVMYCFGCNNKGARHISKAVQRNVPKKMRNAPGAVQKEIVAQAIRDGKIDLSPYNHGQF